MSTQKSQHGNISERVRVTGSSLQVRFTIVDGVTLRQQHELVQHLVQARGWLMDGRDHLQT